MSLDKLVGNRGGKRKFDTEDPNTKPETVPKDKQIVKRVFKLSGTTHSNYPFDSLTKGQPIKLVLDPLGVKTNRHDDITAVAVFDQADKHIAYLPKGQASHVFKYLEDGRLIAEGYIFEVVGGYGDFNFGVDIFVKFTEV